MYKLIVHYRTLHKYGDVVKYYTMLINNINCSSLMSLAEYYCNNKLYNLMEECYGFLVAKDNITSMRLLGLHYKTIGKYDNMLKYLEMAINKGDILSMTALGNHYKGGSFLKRKKESNHINEELAIKYYEMAAEQNEYCAIHALFEYYCENRDKNNIMKYYLLLANHKIANSTESTNIHIAFCNCIKKIYFELGKSAEKYYSKILMLGYKNNIQLLLNIIVTHILNKKIILPYENSQIMKNINYFSDKPKLIMKFNIYKLTGLIYNTSNIYRYYSNFMDVINIPHKNNPLPQNIIFKIAGHLFD